MHEHPVFFKYLKQAGGANFQVYLKNIVSKRHDEYQYSPLEAVLFKFFPCYDFCPYFLTGQKNSHVQPVWDAWEHMVFVHVLKNFFFIHFKICTIKAFSLIS